VIFVLIYSDAKKQIKKTSNLSLEFWVKKVLRQALGPEKTLKKRVNKKIREKVELKFKVSCVLC